MDALRLSFDCPAPVLARVCARYAEPHRRYHTLAHLDACFDARDRLTDEPSPAVDLALLFHDAVYDPLASDNEARSADVMEAEAGGLTLEPAVIARARQLILATRHGEAVVVGADARVVLDADLSILGAAPEVFDAYERAVREEYAAVDEAAYRVGRMRVLRAMVDRPTLYASERGRALWEASARRNVTRSLARLMG
jgi:predicted metal-dependent HD superfamily phosphohydrolase